MNLEKSMILKMIQGFSLSNLLYASCELKLFDGIDNGQDTVDILAQSLGTERETLMLLINPLIANGFIEETGDVLTLTSLGRYLVSTYEETLYPFIIFAGRMCMPAWSRLKDGIVTNEKPFDIHFQTSFFNLLQQDNLSFKGFSEMMGSYTGAHQLNEFLGAYDQQKAWRFVDIGGGTGELMSQLLMHFPNAEGTIIDLAHVESTLSEKLRNAGLDKRCQFIAHDFFRELPIEGDVFVLSKVLHDWNDEHAALILNNVKACMDTTATLWIIEDLLPEDKNKTTYGDYMDALNIWILCGGQERTFQAYAILLQAADLVIEKTFSLHHRTVIIEARHHSYDIGSI